MITCPNCENEVPEEPFCVRCGAPLSGDEAHSASRRGFAAAPNEPWYHPRIASSLFPQLPRADMQPFRIALALGAVLVVVLCLFQLFPLALIAAAVLVPFLFSLYLWDVDLYEEEPLPVLGFTMGWGLVGGIVLGLVAGHIASHDSLTQGSSNTHNVVWLGVILPCIALLVTIAGPLILLPRKSFNDVLDGVTFGGSCAVTLVAAEAITNSASFLQHGFRAAGQDDVWIARLLTLGVALPLLAAGVAGATCGSFWLRFRSAEHRRDDLGVFGSPFLAVPVAAAVLSGAYLSSIYFAQWTNLAATVVLAAASLVWLRGMIHIGLVEEAGETPIGPPIECPSCHHETPLHSFCGNCGISLRALPKHRTSHDAERPPRKARIGLKTKLALFALAAAGAVGFGALAILLTRPAQPKPPCATGVFCSIPPIGTTVPAPNAIASSIFHSGKGWTSDLGVTVHYPSNWDVLSSDKRTLVVKAESDSGLFIAVGVLVQPATSAAGALNDQVSGERSDYLGMATDNSSKDVVLAPEIGFVHGVAGVYKATIDEPPSPSEQVELAFEAATHGKATVVIEAVTNDQGDSSGASSPFPAFEAADELLDTFQWTPDS